MTNGQRASGRSRSYICNMNKATWSDSNYLNLAGFYTHNPIAYRAVKMVADAAADTPMSYFVYKDGVREPLEQHALLDLLQHPNPFQNAAEFFQAIFTKIQISGNAYILITCTEDGKLEMHSLRPDAVEVVVGDGLAPIAYRYNAKSGPLDYNVDIETGQAEILHLKYLDPVSRFGGIGPLLPAARSIDQYNKIIAWYQSLLENGGVPCGVITVKDEDGKPAHLDEERFNRIRATLSENITGMHNLSKPLLLEGGLEWQNISVPPKDTGILDQQQWCARMISLALGVPPQMLAIPGDNSYSNMIEARRAMWEQTVIPLVRHVQSKLLNWLCCYFSLPGSRVQCEVDINKIPIFSEDSSGRWKRINEADFLTIQEKRGLVGLKETV